MKKKELDKQSKNIEKLQKEVMSSNALSAKDQEMERLKTEIALIRMEQNQVLKMEQENIQRIAHVREIIQSNREKGTMPTEYEMNSEKDPLLVMPEINKTIRNLNVKKGLKKAKFKVRQLKY